MALVGAGTALGAALARLLTHHGVAEALLLGVNDPERPLRDLIAELRPQLRTCAGSDLSDLSSADLVLRLGPAVALPPSLWKPGAVLLDAGCDPTAANGAPPTLRRWAAQRWPRPCCAA